MPGERITTAIQAEHGEDANTAQAPTQTIPQTLTVLPGAAQMNRTRTQHDLESECDAERSLSRTSSLTKTLSRVPTASKLPEFTFLSESAFIAVVCMAQLLTQAGLAMSIVPLHIIGRSYGDPTPGELSWLPAAFSLTVGTFILPAGRWGDLFGHKKLFVIGFIWYALWTLVAGFTVWSHSLPFFAFCRAMQGVGPAITLPNAIAILARTYPPGPRKEMAVAIFGATAPVGYVFGAIFSGLLSQFVWWPWAYFIHGMVLGICAILAVFFVPKMPVFGGKPSMAELDLIGTVLGISGLVLFNFAWNQGPVQNWQQPYVWALLVVGILLLVLFFVFEAKWTPYPLVPTMAFTRDTNLVFACIAAGWASFGTWVFYWYQFIQLIQHNSVVMSAVKHIPSAISGVIAAILTGILIGKMQPGWIMMMSMTAFLVGTVLVATTPPEQTYWGQIFFSTIVISWGMDMSFPSGVIVLSNHMPPEHQGLAASLINTIVNYSISIGLGMAGTVEANVNKNGKDLLAGYRGAWYVGIGLDGLGLVLAFCLVLSWRATTRAKEKRKGQTTGEKRV